MHVLGSVDCEYQFAVQDAASNLTVIEERYFPSNFIFLSHSELYSHNNKIATAVFVVQLFTRKKSQVTEEESKCGRVRVN